VSSGGYRLIWWYVEVLRSEVPEPHSDLRFPVARTLPSNANAFVAHGFGLVAFDSPLFASIAALRDAPIDHDVTLGWIVLVP